MNNDHISNIFQAKQKILEIERQKRRLDKPQPQPVNRPALLFTAILALLTTGPVIGLYFIWPHVMWFEQGFFLALLVIYTTYVSAQATRDCYKIATNKD